MGRKYNIYRKKFTSPRTGKVHYGWSVLEIEPKDTDTATFEKVGEVERGEDEGRVALQSRVNKEYGSAKPKDDVSESLFNSIDNYIKG